MAGHARLAVFPGSFDPLTNGHVDMILRAAGLFDSLVVAVLANPSKQPLFSTADRLAMIREATTGLAGSENVEIDTFDGLLVDYVRRRRASAVIRGLRTGSEFAEESQMALMNRHLSPACETLFLVPAPHVGYISSRLVKEVAALGGPLDGLVPPSVAKRLAMRPSTDRTVRA
jgi:pantetheine-phosphate adenylyltransferase